MRELLGTPAATRKYDFLGKKNSVEVRKLSGREVKDFQKEIERLKELSPTEQGTQIQNSIIRLGVVGAQDLTDEELDNFPLDEVSKLAMEVFRFSGINLDEAKAEGNVSATKT